MYNNRQNNQHAYTYPKRNSVRGGSFFRGRGRSIKKLDSRLFIRKAQAMTSLQEPRAQSTFSEYAIAEVLKQNIQDHGYSTPTAIQEQTIPLLLAGKDVIGVANTGTGKTAAFLIPLIQKVYTNPNERILIVTPTRELAMQILDELYAFGKNMNIGAALCIGGANIQRQENRLRQNPHFVIGTPGRLKDLLQRRKLNLSVFHSVVLDEVDRMVDIGFIKDIQYIVSLLAKPRQSLFFSATVSGKVKDILNTFVTHPVTVSVKQQDTAENIDQDIIKVTDKNKKIEVLHDLLISKGFDKVMIFGQTKWGVEKLARNLAERGFRVASIHGNKSQGQRQRALEQFKQNQLQILLATDVASRGLDIDNVTHVINYDAPESYDDYVHRIGRTGRADKKGIALTFVE